jgi:glucan phosphoethanolaminetransferase (alkaline phosphatase superfamily)
MANADSSYFLTDKRTEAATSRAVLSTRFWYQFLVALRPWTEAARPVLFWTLPAALALYAKSVILDAGGGYFLSAVLAGRVDNGQSMLTAWEKFSFYVADLRYGCALIPLALILLSRCLPRRWRFPLCLLVSLVASLAVYAQLRSYQAVGRFVTLQMFSTAFSWGWQEPWANLSYVVSKKLLGALLLVILAGVAAWRPLRKYPLWPVVNKCLDAAGLTWFLVAGLVVSLSWVPAAIPTTSFHRSILFSAVKAYWEDGEVDTREFANLQAPALLERYRELVHAPAPQKDPRYWGKAKGSNILIVVLETTPARYLQIDGPLRDLPNLRQLRERSFVAANHFTTYPSTNRAMFSMLSSWYPSDLMEEDENLHPDLVAPGIMRTLSGLGYNTANFGASRWEGGMDAEMYRSLGVQRLVFPRLQHPAFKHFNENRMIGWEARRVALDEDVLRQLDDDLARQDGSQHPFADVFLPQISHFPLPQLDPALAGQDLAAQEHAILVKEDGWIGQMLQALEQHHQLDNTIIVVTGDHGVRTRGEDASLPSGMIDEYSFHVPMMVYAPQALQHTVTIPWVTSRIDDAPTLLDLLGVDQMRDFEQGTPIWNAQLAQRSTYFFEYSQSGADGYYAGGKFFMWNRLSDSVYESSTLHFGPQNLVLRGSPTYSDVIHSISRMAGLQEVWESRFCSGESVRNHLYDDPNSLPTPVRLQNRTDSLH